MAAMPATKEKGTAERRSFQATAKAKAPPKMALAKASKAGVFIVNPMNQTKPSSHKSTDIAAKKNFLKTKKLRAGKNPCP
jgi:hypothetical protein